MTQTRGPAPGAVVTQTEDRPSAAQAASAVRAAVASLLSAELPAGPLLVACSGGADSLALAVAVFAVAGPDRCRAVTVDHGLQAGSADRATAVAAGLRALGYRTVRQVSVQVSGHGGPEAAARTARYAALAEAAAGDPVLLGHTRDDQAESVLLGLARGSGPRSIAGMRAWRAPYGRPLLAVRRWQTELACQAAGLTWWDDPHNTDPVFTRARLRHEVLPLLDDVLHGGVVGALARTADLLSDDLQALDELAAAALDRARRPGNALDVVTVRTHPPAVRRRVLRAWAAERGAASLTSDHLIRLDALITGGRGSAAVRLPGPIDVLRQEESLCCRPVGESQPAGGRLDRWTSVRPPGAAHARDVVADTR